MIIDSHAHINDEAFINDVDKYIKEAEASNVRGFLCVGSNLETSKQAVEIASKYKNVWAAVGVHPSDVKSMGPNDLALIDEMFKNPKVIAVGEVGLDYFWDKDKKVQEEHPYDLSFRIAADYEFFHWCYRSGKVFMKMPVTVAIFESEQGLSSRNRLLMNREYARANGRSKTISWKLEYTAKVLEVGFNKLWRSLFPQAIVNRIRQHHYSSTSL